MNVFVGKAISKDQYSTTSLDRDTRTTYFVHKSPNLNIFGNARSVELPQPLHSITEQELRILQLKHSTTAERFITVPIA